jgi:uncharacterized protein YxjI
MDVIIQQRKFTLRSEYDISTPVAAYYAEKKLFSFRDRLRLMSRDREIVYARIRGHFFLFRPRYEFELTGGTTYQFWCEKFWKNVFVCKGDQEIYRLYQHKGLNLSIFQADRQIAAFTKNRLKIGKGDRYEIRMNGDADAVIVICLALTIDASENEKDDTTVTYDFGSIGPE